MKNSIVETGKLYEGNWSHLFGPGSGETNCRILIDVTHGQLLAAQAFNGLKWVALSDAEKKDLSESLFDANDVGRDPGDWGLHQVDVLPIWATAPTGAPL